MTTSSRLARRAAIALAVLAISGLARAQVLTPLTTYAWPGTLNSNVVVPSPDETLLFVSNQQSNTVSVLALSPDGFPSLAGIYPTGRMPCAMALDPAGARLYVATVEGIHVHAVGAGGELTTLQSITVSDGTRFLFTGIQYASLAGGDFVYLNENDPFAENRVSAWAVAPDGTLTPAGSYVTGDVGSPSGLYAPPRLLAAEGGRLYAANGASVSAFDVQPDGALALVAGSPFFSPVPPVPLPAPFAVAVAGAPSGGSLYATLDGVNVVRFRVEPDGALAFEALFASDATYPITGLAVHPSGGWVVAAAGPSGARLWDAAVPGGFVQRTRVGTGIVWNASGTLLFGGGASLLESRVLVSRFGPAEAPPVASCVGSPAAPAVVASAPDLCGATVDGANGLAGTCRDAVSCTFGGQPSLVLGPGVASVAVVATSASGATATCTSFVKVVDVTPPTLACPAPATFECTGALTHFALSAGCTDACPTCATSCAEAPLPLGTANVGCAAWDPSGNASECGVPVTIVDTRPPALTVAAAPSVLWPPDHRLVRIDLAATTSDTCDPAPAVSCTASSSEPDDGVADGDTTGDAQWDAEGRLWLRAERAANAAGRVYAVTCTATDASGNSAVASAHVAVPHDDPGTAPPAPVTYSIAGTVTGTGAVAVTLSGAAARSATVDALGRYVFADLVDGTYAVTPSKAGYAFSPASRAVVLAGASVTGVDFAATYALDGTTWSYCRLEESFPQDEWETFTFIGDTLHRTQLEYASTDSSCSGAAHGGVDNAFSGTFTDGGEVQTTLEGAPVVARSLTLSPDGATFLDGLAYVDFAPDPDVLYVAFEDVTALWPRPYVKETISGTTAPALQGSWRSCVTESGNDLSERFTVTGYRVSVVGTAWTSGDGSCTGTATPAFEESVAFVLRGTAAATLGGVPVTAREVDAVFGDGTVRYTLLYVDTSTTPHRLYTGDESDPAHDATAPDRRPLVFEDWKPRVKQP